MAEQAQVGQEPADDQAEQGTGAFHGLAARLRRRHGDPPQRFYPNKFQTVEPLFRELRLL